MNARAKFDIVIPARYESSRFPGKLLADICGKSMIQRVVERAAASRAERVIVAVDDERVAENVIKHTGASVVHTSSAHSSGSDRIAEAAQLLDMAGDRIIVNVQGDEPLMPADLINQVAEVLEADRQAVIGTAAVPFDLLANGQDPNRVKCVIDQNHRALYFSRSVIPWVSSARSDQAPIRLHHLGIYSYTVDYLVEQHSKREMSPLEKAEGLEQLRALYHGDTIAVHIDHDYQGIGVDTCDDLERVRELVARLEK